MIFRALNDQDITSGSITCKKSLSGKILKDALITVNTHISNGSKLDSCWISATKSFKVAVDNYLLPTDFSNQNGRYIALINNCDNSMITNYNDVNCLNYKNRNLINNHELLMNTNLDYFKKIILDLSSKDKYNKLQDKNILLRKNGTVLDKCYLGLSYASNSNEVLIYDHVLNEDLVCILNGFQIDIIYGMLDKLELSNQEMIYLSRVVELKPEYLDLTDMENTIFKEHYINNKNMLLIVQEILKCNKSIDVLELYNYLKKIKKSIISKAIKFYTDCDIYPTIPEDKFNTVRLGNLNIKTHPIFTYKNTTSVIRPLPSTCKVEKYLDFRDVSLIVKYEDDVINDDNIYWLSNGVIMKKQSICGLRSISNNQHKIKTYQKIS